MKPTKMENITMKVYNLTLQEVKEINIACHKHQLKINKRGMERLKHIAIIIDGVVY